MHRITWIALLVIASCAVATAGEKPKTHLDYAEELVRELKPEHNEYAYDHIAIRWRGEDGAADYENRSDCSGFVTLLLARAYGYTPQRFEGWFGKKRPLAATYHDAVVAEQGFKRVRTVREIEPGDFVAIKYTEERKDTGHVMLVAEAPKPRDAAAPLVAGARQYEVVVIDSSKSGHGAADTRRKPDKTFGTGVGKGTIRLYADEAGAVVGYTWSTLPKSEFFPAKDHPIAVGRLDVK